MRNSTVELNDEPTCESSLRPPRYFWRRVGTALIDQLLLVFLIAALILTLGRAIPFQTWWDTGINSTSCVDRTAESAFNAYHGAIKLKPTESLQIVQCEHRSFWIWHQSVLSFQAVTQRGNGKTEHYSLSFSVDDDLQRANTVDISWIVVVLGMIGSAVWINRLGGTPGRLATGLKICDRETNAPAPFRKALIREVLKALPVLLLFSGALLALILMRDFLEMELTPIAVAEAFTIENRANVSELLKSPIFLVSYLAWALGLVYFVTLLWWRGAVLYDRLAGTVVLSDDEITLRGGVRSQDQ